MSRGRLFSQLRRVVQPTGGPATKAQSIQTRRRALCFPETLEFRQVGITTTTLESALGLALPGSLSSCPTLPFAQGLGDSEYPTTQRFITMCPRIHLSVRPSNLPRLLSRERRTHGYPSRIPGRSSLRREGCPPLLLSPTKTAPCPAKTQPSCCRQASQPSLLPTSSWAGHKTGTYRLSTSLAETCLLPPHTWEARPTISRPAPM